MSEDYIIQHENDQTKGRDLPGTDQAPRKFSQTAAQFKTQAADHQYLTGALFLMFWAGKTLDLELITGLLFSLGVTIILFKIWKE